MLYGICISDLQEISYEMVNTCSAANCTKTGHDKVTFHQLPFDSVRREKWVKFVQEKRVNWQPKKASRLCSDHFTEDCWFYPTRKLTPTAVPTIQKNLKLKYGPLPVIVDFRHQQPSKRKRPDCETDNKDRKKTVAELLEAVHEELPSLTAISTSSNTFNPDDETGPTPLPASIPKAATPLEASYPLLTASLPLDYADPQIAVPRPTPKPANDATLQVTDPAIRSTSRPCQKTTSSQTPKRGYVKKRSAATQVTIKSKCKGTVTDPVQMVTIGIQCSLLEPPPPATGEVDDVLDADPESEDDPTWQPPSPSADGSDDDGTDTDFDSFQPVTPDKDKKFLVFESCLLRLFAACPICSSTTAVQKTCIGTYLSVRQRCSSCAFSRLWESQPFIRNIPAGNVLLSAAILYSGSLPNKSLLMLQHLKMACFHKQTFFAHQKTLLHPTIEAIWREDQQMLLDELRTLDNPLVLGGDGRADSPGHNAKYGSYTVMELDSSKVLHVELVQSNEVKNSNAMEKEGLARSVKFLMEEEMVIGTIITDRHLQIQKWIREEMPDTIHYYDVWHVAKGLRKKIEALSKEKDCSIVGKWTRSVCNHLYWAAASTPNGDGDIIRDKWLSVVNHIQDIHEGHGKNFPRCQHRPLHQEEQKRKWLKPGTKACEKLSQLLERPHFLRDVRKLSPGFQTSRIEAYHSVINHFAPKMIGFSYLGMLSRLYLATMHFNENGCREQAINTNGEGRVAVAYPKYKKGQSIVLKVKTDITFDYAERLMAYTCREASKGKAERKTQTHIQVPKPLSHSFHKMTKEEAVARHVTRFTRT